MPAIPAPEAGDVSGSAAEQRYFMEHRSLGSPMHRLRLLCALTYVASLLAEPVMGATPVAKPSATDILAKSQATYAALKSYSDRGTVLVETGNPKSPDKEHRSFTTYYHAPRQFLMINKKEDGSGEELVVWCEGDGKDFMGWWTASNTLTDYPQGQGAVAFATASYPTLSTAVMIPSWLFAGAGLQGPLTSFNLTRDGGVETLNGGQTYKLIGEEVQAYGTGNVTGTRSITIWIDATTLLIRKVVEDTPHDSPAGDLSRQTTTFEPTANPPLDAARFHYVPPAGAKH
jgi:outer membrane lipoprotein-sorting protein